MKFIGLDKKDNIDQNKKLYNRYIQFGVLLNELSKKELTKEVIDSINNGIEEINSCNESEKALSKLIRKNQSKIIKRIEKELKLVPKNHYRNLWLVFGLSAFGVPFGVIFGTSIGNMGFIGIGIPIGMVIGIAIGIRMDKKAFEEGRQLNFEIKY